MLINTYKLQFKQLKLWSNTVGNDLNSCVLLITSHPVLPSLHVIQEVRELLISLFSDDFNSVPKYFSLKNKGFIRNILLLHISDCENPIETLKGKYVHT